MKHTTGSLVIIANLALFMHDELEGHWPDTAQGWTLVILAAIGSLGTATALYRINPPQTPTPPAPASPANNP